MAETTTNYDEHINKMYDSSLANTKAALESDYETNVSNLDAEKEAAQKQTDAALNRTYVEAAKAKNRYNEVQNAYGLTSGAMAQAQLAQNNQLQSDLTTIRAAQQQADAEVERQRSLLAKEYAAAITKAQSVNDMARAQALYEEAKQADADLLAKQKEAASLMAGAGDFSLYQALYGLTDAQAAALKKAYSTGTGTGTVPVKVPDPGTETGTETGPETGTSVIGSIFGGLGQGIKNLFGLGGTENADISRDSVREQYIALKKAKVPQKDLDALLKAAVAEGLDQRDANDIRDARY